MATLLRRPEVLTPKRDVSPLNTSRFERPLSKGVLHSPTSASPTLPQLPPDLGKLSIGDESSSSAQSINDVPLHVSKPSVASTAPTYSTAQTSVHRHERDSDDSDIQACPPIEAEDQDAWFTRQTESDQYLAVDEGDVCPDGATLAAVQDLPVYDAEGNAVPFGTLYDPETATHQRQLLIFVRHFYCGACQAYLKALISGISMEDYFSIPIPTSIVIIGCGKPDIIPQYRKLTNQCQFTMLAEPTRTLFKKLGMGWSTSFGPERPDYMKDTSVYGMIKGQVRDVNAAVRDPEGIRKRDVFRGGHMFQIGGEFLFEDGEVVWCHRMKHMRNREYDYNDLVIVLLTS